MDEEETLWISYSHSCIHIIALIRY